MNQRDADNLDTIRRALKSSELESLLYWHINALRLPEPEQQYRFDDARRWRFDFAWPSCKVAVEVNGGEWAEGRHNRGAGMAADYEKLNAAVIAGWRVLQFTGSQVRDGDAVAMIERALATFDVQEVGE